MSAPADVGNVLVGLIGLANIGAIIYLVKIVIAPIAATVHRLNESVEELYKSRNAHEGELIKINTVHRLKGCDRSGSET